MWIYSQSSGQLKRYGSVVASGYSGCGDGKNNPKLEHIPDMGPIPRGSWYIGRPADSIKLGPHVMALYAEQDVPTFGRSGFYIHGDSLENPGEASQGCIVIDHDARIAISESGDNELTVIA